MNDRLNKYYSKRDVELIENDIKDLDIKTREAMIEYLIILKTDCDKKKIATGKMYAEAIESGTDKDDVVYIRSLISALNNITTDKEYYPAIIALSAYKKYKSVYERGFILDNKELRGKTFNKCVEWFEMIDNPDRLKETFYNQVLNEMNLVLSLGYDSIEDKIIQSADDLKTIERFKKENLKLEFKKLKENYPKII